FFFSSRRRHTRFSRDWSSDVCSSDLEQPDPRAVALRTVFAAREYRWSEPNSTWVWLLTQWHRALDWLEGLRLVSPVRYYIVLGRSEERRVGKECSARVGARWSRTVRR